MCICNHILKTKIWLTNIITPDFDKAKRQGELDLEDVAHGLMSEGRVSFFKPNQTVFSGDTLNTFRPICAINGNTTAYF